MSGGLGEYLWWWWFLAEVDVVGGEEEVGHGVGGEGEGEIGGGGRDLGEGGLQLEEGFTQAVEVVVVEVDMALRVCQGFQLWHHVTGSALTVGLV